MADNFNTNGAEVQQAVDAALKQQKKEKKKKKWIIIGVILLVLIIIGVASGGKNDEVKERTTAGDTSVGTDNEIGAVDVTVKTTEAAKEENAEYEIGKCTAHAYYNSINTAYITVVVPVKNTGNTNLYLSSCTIDVENSNGTLEDTLSMVSVYPQVIKPGETAYYYEDTFYDGDSFSGLKAIPHVEVEKATVKCIRYEVSEVQIKNEEYFGSYAMGRVENTTDADGSSVYVVVNFYDSDKNLICQQFDILDDGLKAGEKKSFKTSNLDSVDASKISSYSVYAFPYQYQF